MLLYNATLIIEEASAEAWMQWMQGEYLPDLMETGLFISKRLLKVVDSPNEGLTYCVQFIAETQDACDIYQNEYAPAFIERMNIMFKDKYVSFNTIMEFID
jgi:hypothetical protein